MERFIHDENLALFKKKLADPRLTDEERKVVLKLLADEEARQILSQGGTEDRKSG
jgi:hypothetical protein